MLMCEFRFPARLDSELLHQHTQEGEIVTKSRDRRTPLGIILAAILLGFIGTLSLFGGTSQATPPVEMCKGKGCVECDNSTQECPEPPPPTPTPAPEPSPTPDLTPTPTPSTPPAPTPEPSTPSPEPASTLARTGASSNLVWFSIILAALGWEIWSKAQQKRRA